MSGPVRLDDYGTNCDLYFGGRVLEVREENLFGVGRLGGGKMWRQLCSHECAWRILSILKWGEFCFQIYDKAKMTMSSCLIGIDDATEG